MTLKDNRRLTQAERTEISDTKMLNAAVELIVEHGPAGTSLKEVGLKAGYSRGLAGERFGSKDRMFAFVLRQVGDEWLGHLKKATRGITGIEAIHHALDEHYRFCVEAPDHVRTFYTLWFESVNAGSELKQIIGNIHNRRTKGMPWDDQLEPMAYRLHRMRPEARLVSLDMAYPGGTAWVCFGQAAADCKAQEIKGPASAEGKRGVELSEDGEGEPYDGRYFTGPISASEPAVEDSGPQG